MKSIDQPFFLVWPKRLLHLCCVLQVQMEEGQTVEEGQKIADDLMEKLGVLPEDLLTGAYLDMLLKKQPKEQGTEQPKEQPTEQPSEAGDAK